MSKISLAFTLLLVTALLSGCISTPAGVNATMNLSTGESAAAKAGDVVRVDYVGTFEDGTLFDTSVESEARAAGLPLRPSYEPLEFTLGAGQMIPGFDAAVAGMRVGETKTVHLPPEQAYGQARPDYVVHVPLAVMREGGVEPIPGLSVQAGDGAVGKITAVGAETVTVDFNHELAGKTLIFKITLRAVNPA